MPGFMKTLFATSPAAKAVSTAAAKSVFMKPGMYISINIPFEKPPPLVVQCDLDSPYLKTTHYCMNIKNIKW